MVLIRNQFHPGPVLHRFAQAEAKLGDAEQLPLDELARRIRVGCGKADLSLADFMRGVGRSLASLYRIEKGLKPSVAMRAKLESALRRLEAAG